MYWLLMENGSAKRCYGNKWYPKWYHSNSFQPRINTSIRFKVSFSIDYPLVFYSKILLIFYFNLEILKICIFTYSVDSMVGFGGTAMSTQFVKIVIMIIIENNGWTRTFMATLLIGLNGSSAHSALVALNLNISLPLLMTTKVWKHTKKKLINTDVVLILTFGCLKLAIDDSQEVCETWKTCEMWHVCMGYFVLLFMLLHETDFSCFASRTISR